MDSFQTLEIQPWPEHLKIKNDQPSHLDQHNCATDSLMFVDGKYISLETFMVSLCPDWTSSSL